MRPSNASSTARSGLSWRGASTCHPMVSGTAFASPVQVQRALPRAIQPNAIAAHGAAPNAQESSQRAPTPSDIAIELHKYASNVAAASNRSIDTAFLESRLDELSPIDRLRRLRPRQLAALARSLSRIGFHPGDDWLTELDACCYCHPGPFDPISATVLLQSLAALHAAAQKPSSPPKSSQPSQQHGTNTKVPPPQHQQRHLRTTALSSARHTHMQRQRHRAIHSYGRSSPSISGAQLEEPEVEPPAPAPAAAAASFRFPHAVYLRLLQGGVNKYTYEQLAKVLQAFRSLGVPITDELATQVGARMARQLMEMSPGRRQRALAAVMASG